MVEFVRLTFNKNTSFVEKRLEFVEENCKLYFMNTYRTSDVVLVHKSGEKQTRRVCARDIKHLRRILRVCQFVASEITLLPNTADQRR